MPFWALGTAPAVYTVLARPKLSVIVAAGKIVPPVVSVSLKLTSRPTTKFPFGSWIIAVMTLCWAVLPVALTPKLAGIARRSMALGITALNCILSWLDGDSVGSMPTALMIAEPA